jgi:hypothetical protein
MKGLERNEMRSTSFSSSVVAPWREDEVRGRDESRQGEKSGSCYNGTGEK